MAASTMTMIWRARRSFWRVSGDRLAQNESPAAGARGGEGAALAGNFALDFAAMMTATTLA